MKILIHGLNSGEDVRDVGHLRLFSLFFFSFFWGGGGESSRLAMWVKEVYLYLPPWLNVPLGNFFRLFLGVKRCWKDGVDRRYCRYPGRMS